MTPPAAPISVVVPCYNAEAYVRDAIASVRAQTHPPIEVICVDDGSTDRTLRVLNELASTDARVWVLTGPNRGAAAARNRGVAAAEGAYIQFLDTDDCLQPEKLAHQWDLIDRSPTPPDVVFGAFDVVAFPGTAGDADVEPRTVDPDPWCGLLRGIGSPGGCGHTCSNLWRRDSVLAVGGFREEVRTSEDNVLVTDMFTHGASVLVDPAHHTLIRTRSDSLRTSDGLSTLQRLIEYRLSVLEHLQTSGLLTPFRKRLAVSELIPRIGTLYHLPGGREVAVRLTDQEAFSLISFRETYAERGLLYAVVSATAGLR